MLRYTHLILLFLFSLSVSGQTDENLISGDFEGVPFEDFVRVVESSTDYQFYYKQDWVKEIILEGNYTNQSISDILDNELKGSSLFFHINESRIFLTYGFAVKTDFSKREQDTNFIFVEYEEQVEDEEQATRFEVIDIGNPSDDASGNVTISGYIKDFDSGEPVIGAVVYATEINAAAMTNQYGYYSLTIPRGSYQFQYTCLGMSEISKQVNAYGSGKLDVEMSVKMIPLRGVTVTANTDIALSRMEVGLEKLSMQTINFLPTALGEVDIINSVLLLPGVQTVGEGAQGFNVRGGSTDQNLILLYDAPIFNSSHFFGFFSGVNGEVIKDISLYKGGIPAQYGGRVSSVLDIIPKDGNSKKISGSGGISPVTANLMIEGPIVKDKSSFHLAGRSTYSNWLLKLIEDPYVSNSRSSFFDVNARFVHEFNENNKLEFSGYISNDKFRFNLDTLYSYNNRIFSLKWRRVVSKKLFSVYSLNYSGYDYDISSDKNTLNGFNLHYNINFANLKADFTYFPNLKHKIDFGISVGGYLLRPGELSPVGDSSIVVPAEIEQQNAIESAIYLNDEYLVSDRITLSAGIRLTLYSIFGPGTVMNYNPELARNPNSILDTLYFNSGEHIKSYFNPEVRLGMNYRLGPTSSFKLNYTRTSQNLHLLSNTTSISPTDIWVLSNYHLKPQTGDQISIGYYRNFRENVFETSVEAYYKVLRNMVDFKGGAKLLLNETIETDVVNTQGRAYGIETMIKKPKGRFNGWASYTYSRILMRSVSEHPEEAINEGEWFPANYDKPHSLTLVANYMASRRVTFSSTYVYSTGRPITYPATSYDFYGARLLHYSDRNQYRIPDYSRLDISATLSIGKLRSNKIGYSTLTFSVYNLLGRQNVYSVYFQNDGKVLKGYKLSIFARPIPSITYNFKF